MQPTGPHFEIPESYGVQRGNNLFHSFQKFNLNSSESATFTGRDSIANVISRVTGGEASSIDGLLRSEIKGANLYLLNPDGILFGPNAHLDIKGAFHASTADSLPFPNGEVFEARADGRVPILATADPSAFGFLGESAGPIDLNGSQLGGVDRITLQAGTIDIRSGATIGDSGYGIFSFSGSDSRNAVGAISLVASDRINVQQSALYGGSWPIYRVSENSSSIRIDAPRVQVTDGSRINVAAGSIRVAASENIVLDGSDINTEFSLQLSEGTILMEASSVELAGGTQVQSEGDILLAGEKSVTLSGVANRSGINGFGSSVASESSVRVAAPVVRIDDGGRIAVEPQSLGTGSGVHTVWVIAPERLTLSGTNGLGFGSSIDASYRLGAGAGSIRLNAPVIRLRDGAKITARVDPLRMEARLVWPWPEGLNQLPWLNERGALSATGKSAEIYKWFGITPLSGSEDSHPVANVSAGSIKIIASDSLELSGVDRHGFGSMVDTSSRVAAASSSIWIDSPAIQLRDNARITTLFEPPTLDPQWIVADDYATFSINILDRDSNSKSPKQSLKQGDITIFTDSMSLQDSSISATTVGDASNILRSAGSVFIMPSDGKRDDRPSGNYKQLVLRDSKISASASNGAGDGGDVVIVNELVALTNSSITTQADAGKGGNIRVIANKYFASENSVVDASAGPAGIDGRIKNTAQRFDVSNLANLATEFLTAPALMRPHCTASAGQGSLTVAPRRGLPISPEGPLVAFEAIDSGFRNRVEHSPAFGQTPGAGDFVSVGLRSGPLHPAVDVRAVPGNINGDVAYSAMRGNELRSLADAQQLRGEFEASVETLRDALVLAEQTDDPIAMASTLGGLGNALLATGHTEQSAQLITRAIVLAKNADKPSLAAGLLNNLGNQQMASDAFEKALTTYLESARIAQGAGDPEQHAKALSNAARVALQLRQNEQAYKLLERAFGLVNSLTQSRDQAVIRIHVAKSYAELALVSEHRKHSLIRAYEVLQQAIEISEELDDDLNLSYALGYLGALYHSQSRYEEALYLTRRALGRAERADAPESIYRWHWQEGRLLWAQGRAGEAMAALRRAVAILEETQQETLAQYGSAAVYFRKTIAPVYLQLVDILLQRAAAVGDARQAQDLRIEARTTIEQLKAAELRDYFRDECVADLEAKTKNLEAVSTTAAVVYPIMLPDRLELLVSLPTGLQQYSVPVPSLRLAEAIRELREQLESRHDMQAVSRQLYEWLVQPYVAQLVEADIDTLVFVPDGLLRTIPLAALRDDDRYLVEQYRVAVTPGLSLIDPKPLDRSRARPLLAGLSESVQGFPALTHVPEELSAVHREYGGEILLDEDFTLDKVQKSFENKEPTIVHIASHGRFTGDPKSSFILTYDGRLSMDRLSAYVGLTQYRDQPLELLVLSACETAASDERAALGLAGVGVQAGARSALGSLWSISDEATSHLVGEFYTQLKDPGVSKAQALQQAQLKLLDSPRFSHPFYWSSFLLINNWL